MYPVRAWILICLSGLKNVVVGLYPFLDHNFCVIIDLVQTGKCRAPIETPAWFKEHFPNKCTGSVGRGLKPGAAQSVVVEGVFFVLP